MPDLPAPVNVTLLGTGTSTGVPVIGCTCRVCTSRDPKDRRRRASALVEIDHPEGPLTIILDTGPDFRQQALDYDIRRLDAVCYTHAHYDHIAGIDDLRPFFYDNRSPLPCYVRSNAAEALRNAYGYIFTSHTYKSAPNLQLREVRTPFVVKSRYGLPATARVTPLEVKHGEEKIYGYRIGSFAYLTDTSHIPDAVYDKLQGLDVLVLDALRHRPHPAHLTIEQAVSVASLIGAEKTYFTHITHDVLHDEEDARLPKNMHFGYDGLSFECALEEAVSIGETASSVTSPGNS